MLSPWADDDDDTALDITTTSKTNMTAVEYLKNTFHFNRILLVFVVLSNEETSELLAKSRAGRSLCSNPREVTRYRLPTRFLSLLAPELVVSFV
jgi:hypothetical protein